MILNCRTTGLSETISSSKQLSPSPSNWVQFSKILIPLRLATAIRTKLCNISSRSVSATPLQHRAMWFCGENTGERRKKKSIRQYWQVETGWLQRRHIVSAALILSQRCWQLHVPWRWFYGQLMGKDTDKCCTAKTRVSSIFFLNIYDHHHCKYIPKIVQIIKYFHHRCNMLWKMCRLSNRTWKTRASHQAAVFDTLGARMGCQWSTDPLMMHHLRLILSFYKPVLLFLLINDQSFT